MIAPTTVVSDRYAVERVLARGGMAEVWLARDRLLDRPVALKVLFPELSRDPSFVERFRREAQAAANLNHPSIVAVYDWGQDGDDHYIVMEYVEGRTLRDVLRDEGTLAPDRAAAIGAEIAAALAFAHGRGVVHRDIKPGNVLITPDGRVKVADFGIARAGTSEALTQTGSVMGTATYFSPEQAQGLDVDGRSDIYSLGVVLYEAVVGSPPFVNDNPLSVALQHVRDEPVPPSKRDADLPRAFDTVVMVCLQKDRARRYQSAEDVGAELKRFLAGQPVTASVPEATALTAAVVGTGAAAVAGATAAGGRIFGGGAGLPPGAAGAGGGAPPPYAPRRGRGKGPIVAILAVLAVLVAVIAALLLTSASGSGGGPDVLIESFTGQPANEAAAVLRSQGFDVRLERETNAFLAEGLVIATDPEAGTRAERGSLVVIRVSDGLEKAAVPDLRDRTVEEAEKVVRDAGFEFAVAEQADDAVRPGTIVRQTPAAGERATKGSKVTAYVAKPSDVTVPNVVNLQQAEAVRQLGDAGFRLNLQAEASPTVPAQHVIRTDPGPNALAPKGSTVSVWISSGPERVEVPGVVGQTQSQARATLEAAGFDVDTDLVPSGSANAGKVIAQDPTAGTRAGRGSTVTITVGQAAAPTTTSPPTTTTGGGGGDGDDDG